MKILDFTLNFVVIWAPIVLAFLLLALLAIQHLLSERRLPTIVRPGFLTSKKLIIFLLSAGLLFRLLLTGLQYYVWRISGLGRFLLPPYQPADYFLRYSLFHFWLPGLLSLILALMIYAVFYLMKRRRAEIISQENLNLVFLLSLLAGWPKIIIFLAFFLVLALIVIGFKSISRRKPIDLAWPLLLAMLLTLFFGNYLIAAFGLFALAV